jgi:cell division protein FtsB
VRRLMRDAMRFRRWYASALMKWLAASLFAALLLLQYRLWLSGDGVREVWRLRSAVAVQQSENTRLLERNRQLGAEVRDLKQGYAALEERARSDLGMVAGNETFYQVVPPRPLGGAPPRAPAVTTPAPPQRTAAAH